MDVSVDYLKSNPGLILAGGLTIILLYKLTMKSSVKLPPGPYPIPVIGTIYKHGVNITADVLTDISKTYGAIFSVFLGPRHFVILNSYESIHEAMIRPTEFSHRGLSDKYTWKLLRTEKMHGLFPQDYHDELISDRKICMGIMRKLGMGKTVIEDKILLEVDAIESILRAKIDESLDLHDLILSSICNVTTHILVNKRFEYGDAEMKTLLDSTNEIKNINITALVDIMPSLRLIPPFKGIFQKFVTGMHGIAEFMKDHTLPILHQFDPNHTDSFVESYFKNYFIEQSNEIDVDMDTFKFILLDLFAGGTETSATGIKWALVYLTNRQDMQEKLYQEMTANTDAGQPVRYSDKERLPFLEAVVLEVQRFGNIGPLILHKSSDRNAQLGGYCIPKSTIVLLNIHSVHMDVETWGDPFIFRPERFIDEDGKFVNHKHVIPFSLGKRACPGEILAKQELYLFIGNLFKRFRFVPPEDIEKVNEEPVKTAMWGPQPFKVKVIPR